MNTEQIDTVQQLMMQQAERHQFIYHVSHDLNSAARLMVEFSRLLEKDYAAILDEEGKEYVAIIVENGTTLLQKLDALVTLSHLQTTTSPFIWLDANHLVDECKIILGEKITQTGARIECMPLPKIKGSPQLIQQLFTILLDNALTFYVPGTHPNITISTVLINKQLCFQCVDHGIGIDNAFHTSIFGLFERLHTQEEYPGLGAGLAFAKQIVALHKGIIWCESRAGGGTQIMFTLPVEECE